MATMIPDAPGSVRGDDEDSIIRHRLLTHTASARGEPPLNKVAKASVRCRDVKNEVETGAKQRCGGRKS